MPRVESAIYSILSTSTAITGIVSSKIYPVFVPQTISLPAVTYYRVSTVREEAMHADPGWATARIQISAWATSALLAGTLADAVRNSMHRHVGIYAGVTITDLAIENEITTYDPDTEEHQVAMDFMVSHIE